MRPAVFYFSIEELEKVATGPYNIPALKSTFSALLEADRPREAAFELRQGDLLLYTLCYLPTKVELGPRKIGTNVARSVAVHTTGDTDLFQTLIWDLDDAISAGWRSIESDTLFESVGYRDVFTLTLTDLAPALRDHLDKKLRETSFYLGGFEADPGNPVQRHIAVETLVNSFDYRAGALLFDLWRSEDPFDPPPLDRHGDEWYLQLDFTEVRYMTEEERRDPDLVVRWPEQPASERGSQSARVLAGRRDGGHLARLAEDISRLPVDDEQAPFVVKVDAMPRAADAVVEESKLRDYLLDPEHPSGRDKARWFSAVLGIERDDWRHLSSQLRQGLAEASEFRRLRGTPYGLRYEVETPIAGLNSTEATVTSAWQIDEGGPPRLITAVPGELHQSDATAPRTLTVPAGMPAADRWSALWSLAERYADDAAAAIVPTPMRITGGPTDEWLDEPYGFASIAVRDARRGFARWLVATGRAETRRGVGAVFSAPGIAFERSRAWAEAFVEVLGFNGVEATSRAIYN